MNTVPFNKKDVKAYLDKCIVHWRKKRAIGNTVAEQYIDAFQSVRISLFGEVLQPESRPTKDADDSPKSGASDNESKPTPKRVI